MSSLSIRALAIGLLLTSGLLAACTSTAKDVFKGVDRIVAAGDLHGDYDQYIKVLTTNGLVDEQLRWQGGKTHFVQLGDVVDRGPDSLRIIRHLMKLEKEAKKKGGRVHVLIGNHEAMNIQGDLRYVHPGEYSALISEGSDALRDRYLEAVYKHQVSIDPTLAANPGPVMEGLKKKFPLGYVEHRSLWEPGQEIAKWVASHNAVIRINDSLFVHGGLSPHVEPQKLSKINRRVRSEISVRFDGEGLSNSQDGPLWYRGLASNEAEVELAPLLEMLKFYDVNRIFIAHTPTNGAILTRLDGTVIMIDVGISAHYGSSLANIVIEDGTLQVMHRGSQVPFPGDGLSIQAYLEMVSALEPLDSRLKKYVHSMDDQLAQEKEKMPQRAVN
jgi:hypothetical protein